MNKKKRKEKKRKRQKPRQKPIDKLTEAIYRDFLERFRRNAKGD